VIAAVCLFGMGNGMATLVRATAIADAYGSAFYGSIAGVAAACATAARAVAPVVAAGAYVAFKGYEPLLWLLVVASVLAALAARLANRRLAKRHGLPHRLRL
jgi:MFS family permease